MALCLEKLFLPREPGTKQEKTEWWGKKPTLAQLARSKQPWRLVGARLLPHPHVAFLGKAIDGFNHDMSTMFLRPRSLNRRPNLSVGGPAPLHCIPAGFRGPGQFLLPSSAEIEHSLLWKAWNRCCKWVWKGPLVTFLYIVCQSALLYPWTVCLKYTCPQTAPRTRTSLVFFRLFEKCWVLEPRFHDLYHGAETQKMNGIAGR